MRIRGTRQNVSTDHLRQNLEPSLRGDSARTAHLAPVDCMCRGGLPQRTDVLAVSRNALCCSCRGL